MQNTYGTTNSTAYGTPVHYNTIINKGYQKAGAYAQAADNYKTENIQVKFSSEHIPGEFGYLQKFHQIRPTPYGHTAGYGRRHSYYGGQYGGGRYDGGRYGGRSYGKRHGGGYNRNYKKGRQLDWLKSWNFDHKLLIMSYWGNRQAFLTILILSISGGYGREYDYDQDYEQDYEYDDSEEKYSGEEYHWHLLVQLLFNVTL